MNDFLPDTHLIIWSAEQDSRLPIEADRLLNDPGNRIFFSVASLWEIAIKSALGRNDFQINLAELTDGLLAHGYIELPVTRAHALAVQGASEDSQGSIRPNPDRSVDRRGRNTSYGRHEDREIPGSDP